ncbi:MAG TPA: serpin family protein, partial [Candidatus Obscuribacterales bacterium]
MFKQLWQKLTRREDRPEAAQATQAASSPRPRLSTAELASLPDSGLMQANHRFAFKLWLALQARDPGANLFFSPLSISMVLALLAQGARGLSRTELETVLGTAGLPPEELLKDCQTLMRFLQLQGRGVELRLANSLWLPQQLALEPDFQALARQVFQAEAVNLDFSSPEALAEINAWASTQTHGRIASILNDLDPDSVLILLNAIWFKGSWQEPFLPAATRPEPFQRASGDSVSAATMVQRLECRHRLLEGRCQVLALNYGLEAQASFYALLPE